MPDSRPGNYRLKELRLIGRNNEIVDLDNYLLELNIHEDIFSNSVHGSCVIADQRNILRFMPLEGQEILLVHLVSDRFAEDDENAEIKKQFRVYSVSDRYLIRERNMQGYTLNFCSLASFKSALTPLYRPFEGDTVTDVARIIYDEYLTTERYPGIETELDIFDEAVNPIKFISPGWQPFKCMNWLAQKSISAEGSACNYLFWESCKRYYFGSLEWLFRYIGEDVDGRILGEYSYKPADINAVAVNRSYAREFFKLEDAEIVNSADQLSMTTDGDLASTVLTIDINKKEFTNTIYQHTEGYFNYTHLPIGGGELRAIWGESIEINPKNSIYYYPKNTKLFDEFPNNTNEVFKDIYGKRKANLRDMHNFRLHISIPGRSDVQAGAAIRLLWPNATDKYDEDTYLENWDMRYSGIYLITAVRHKITIKDYVCILEVAKDSFPAALADGSDEYQLNGPDQSAAETARLNRLNEAAGTGTQEGDL